jgi:hypothetical protein
LGFTYTFSQFSQPSFGNFSTHTGNLFWVRNWTREISTAARGGLTLVEPIPAVQPGMGQSAAGEKIAATMFPTGGLAVTYTSASPLLRAIGGEVQNISPTGGVGVVGGGFLPILAGSTLPGTISSPGTYSVSMNYNLGIFPSYVSAAGPIYTHIVSLNGSAGITDRLTTFAAFNFAHSSYTSDVVDSTFNSYGTIVMLNYLITRTLQASLSHMWLNFGSESAGGATAADFSMSKQMVMLGLSYAYSPRGDFFRSGGFWESPSPSGSSTTGPAPGKSGSGGVEIKK